MLPSAAPLPVRTAGLLLPPAAPLPAGQLVTGPLLPPADPLLPSRCSCRNNVLSQGVISLMHISSSFFLGTSFSESTIYLKTSTPYTFPQRQQQACQWPRAAKTTCHDRQQSAGFGFDYICIPGVDISGY